MEPVEIDSRPRMDLSDSAVGLARHSESGATYIIGFASLWDGERCIGTTITDVRGPVAAGDYLDALGRPRWELIHLRAGDDNDDLCSWMQEEDEHGRLEWPWGIRSAN